MAGEWPDQPVRAPMSRHQWAPITFLHVRVDADDIARLLPSGLEPDLLDGQAWLGLTPLLMRAVRPTALPPVPGWSWFPELNVRTYVRGPGGRDGLWFFALDCPRRLMVLGGRALGMPYRFRAAAMRERADGTAGRTVEHRFHDGRRWRSLVVRPGAPISRPSPLEVLLTGRWNAYARPAGRLLRLPAEHEPWPLQRATISGDLLEHSVLDDLGLRVLPGEPLVHFSSGVKVRLGAPRPA